jgi:mono/diheme cytochrome c family protein
MKIRSIIIAVAAAVVLVAGALALTTIFGPDPFDFAGGHRVHLAGYQGPDPTGVPLDLKNASLIRRGEYLAWAADCQACHTASGGLPYAGGLPISTPFGTLYSTNITPDKATGIGDYSDADFLAAVHRGIRRDGARLYPAMPYLSYTYMTDADAIAIKAFLFSLQPVHAPAMRDRLSFPFNLRYLMTVWSLLFNADRRYQPNPERSAQWNRGAYLVEALAHCGECHTPRNLFEALNNRQKFAGAVVDGWRAYNITSHRDSGVGAWSDTDLAGYLATGHAEGHGAATGPMGEAVSNSLSHLEAADISAILDYLRTIPAIATSDLTAPRPAAQVVRSSAATDDNRGQAVFAHACASCHGSDGLSPLTPFATLIGSRSVNDPTAANVVRIILFGAHDYKTMMPALGRALSDDDIASVTNYVTGRFGAVRSAVTSAEVAAIRTEWTRSQDIADQPTAVAIESNLAPHPPLVQPIPFSHKDHVAFGLECSSCHVNPEKSSEMSLPPATTCMSCHAAVAKDNDAIKKLAEFAASSASIPWVRIYPLLPGVQFNHQLHLRAGVQCTTCHGAVSNEPVLSEMTAVTSMATCISCHQAQHVKADCATCHAWPNGDPDGPKTGSRSHALPLRDVDVPANPSPR